MKTWIVGLILLSGCAAKVPSSDDWITVWNENKLPLGSYSQKTDQAIFYGSAEDAFKQLMKVIIASNKKATELNQSTQTKKK